MTDCLATLSARDLLEEASRIAALYGVTVPEMMGRRRYRAHVYARQHFWAHLYAKGYWSYTRIGELCGYDHTSVYYGINAHHRRHCGTPAPALEVTS